ncbi:MAG: shikimate kinase [Eubacteriales bacterium]|nr:shikimate kinase [Eubacteriales bacterium]
MNNIVLIGMPGSGKSTLGVLLAKAMGRDFVDTDVLIQVKNGSRLQALLNRFGVDGFLKLEEQAVLELDVENTVIATGGSVVYSAAAMEHLRQNGIIVYLELPYEEIERRIRNLSTRGVALREGQTLRGLYDERIPLYQSAADVSFRQPTGSAESAVEKLCDILKSGR